MKCWVLRVPRLPRRLTVTVVEAFPSERSGAWGGGVTRYNCAVLH